MNGPKYALLHEKCEHFFPEYSVVANNMTEYSDLAFHL